MRGKAPPTYKRRGCTSPRERWQLVCAECWKLIPAPTRARYSSLRRRHLTFDAKRMGSAILKDLGRKPAEAQPAIAVHARIAAMLGERDQLEPAE